MEIAVDVFLSFVWQRHIVEYRTFYQNNALMEIERGSEKGREEKKRENICYDCGSLKEKNRCEDIKIALSNKVRDRE